MKKIFIKNICALLVILIIICSCNSGNRDYNEIKLHWSYKETVQNLSNDNSSLYCNPDYGFTYYKDAYYYIVFGFDLFSEDFYGVNGYAAFDYSGKLLNSKKINPITFDINKVFAGINKKDFEDIFGKPHFIVGSGTTKLAYLTDAGTVLFIYYDDIINGVYNDDNILTSITEIRHIGCESPCSSVIFKNA